MPITTDLRRYLAFAALIALALPIPVLAQPAGVVPGHAPAIDYGLSVAEIRSTCTEQIGLARKSVANLIALSARHPNFSNAVLPLENLTADLNDRLVAQELLYNVSLNRAVRDASLKCQNEANDFLTEVTARPELYRAIAGAQSSGTARSVADRKLTELWLVALKRSGAGLAPVARKRFVVLSQKLSALQNQYLANLGNATTSISLTQGQTAGLPADFIATFTKKDERYIVPVNESTSGRFMESASDPSARRAFYFANGSIAVPRNVKLLQQALAIRYELAHLLGYPSWAAYVLADRMAANPGKVDAFLADLDRKVLPRAREELGTLQALKAKDTGKETPIRPWDVSYYDNRLRKTRYAVDTSHIRRYFPVEHVERAVFEIYSKILGVTFVRRTGAESWAPDVTEWAVSDTKSGRYIGDFYLDLFPREGKYSHFASFPLLAARRRADGSVRPPLDAIIGNWPKAAPGQPALLSHGDVETFFHEFGHDMATMLATSPYETLSGGFRQDFIEAPSQMLENWVWDPVILKHLSANIDTGAPLPDETIEKMIAARYVDNAYFTTRQIMLATIDMAYHSGGPKVDTTSVWRKVSAAQTPLAVAAGIRPEAQFGHLMGGYDAGYYGYLWSKVYAQDMFTAFVAGGLESPVVGARYRRTILEPAREREPDQEVRAFLGRPMNPAAFYKEFEVAPVAGPAIK